MYLNYRNAKRALADWMTRKRKRCGKAVHLLKLYSSKTCHRYPRCILYVAGEKFTRRLHYFGGYWKEVEHGVLDPRRRLQ